VRGGHGRVGLDCDWQRPAATALAKLESSYRNRKLGNFNSLTKSSP
jgi:hypothetical protein